MAKAFIDDTHLTDIADAIRATLDENRQYLPSEMAAAIDSIPIMAQLNRKKYFQAVPAGAASGYATIEQVEGNTVVWNQLLKQGKLLDMGLPSGLLWATCNIDITQEDGFAASPFQYGCTMFSWGNIEGHNTPASGTTFDYNWGSVNAQAPWYEGQVYGSTPGSTLTSNIVAGDTYDSARYNVGSLFKMPTSVQFQELIDNCDFVQADGTTVITSTDKRVIVNGIRGIYLKSKINGNLIFFSASGLGHESSWNSRGTYGLYWSSSFYSSRYARYLYFSSGGVYPQDNNYRCYGFAVRAVVNPNTIIDTGHNNHKYYVTEDIIHDLTLIFGSGNEPTTVAEFEAWLAENIGTLPYYDYNAGELLSVKMSGMQTEDSSQQTVDTLPFDVTTITGINTTTNVRETIFPQGMKQADRDGLIKDTLDLRSDTATVNVGSRAYQSGDESDPDVLTDGTTTYYALTTPNTYTNLQDANGNPMNPRYKVERGGTEQVLPVNTSTPTTVAPTLSTIYKKNA